MTTKPNDCVLVLAIPLNRDDFFAGLDLSLNKDFAKGIARRYSSLPESALWEMTYSRTVTTVISVAQAVSAQGVTVITNATLNDIRELFQQFRVITLVAHWRSSKFHLADFLNTDQLIKALEQPSSPLIESFVSVLPERWISTIRTLESTVDNTEIVLKALRNKFNNILKFRKLYFESKPNQLRKIAPYDETYHKYLNRLVIDSIFKGIIPLGNRIELFDGFHSIEEFVTTIPKNYDGLLDFTVCNSVLIGNVVKRKRQQCNVRVNEKPATPEVRMVIYKSIIELLAQLDMDYMDAAAMIRRMNS